MDFYNFVEKATKNGRIEVTPDFRIGRTTDLMVRGKAFYAIWDAKAGMWSTDEYDVQRLIDEDLDRYIGELRERSPEKEYVGKYAAHNSSGVWKAFQNYVKTLSDSYHPLDEKLTFANTVVTKTDYVSRRLPYPLNHGTTNAWDELLDVLYDPSERAKIEWAIGAIVAGEAKHLQKFIVFYGPAGAGKSTVINIIQKLFAGYYTTFDAKALTGSNNAFSTEVFSSNPLVAIQHDGDLSGIEDNTKLNSITSHEEMTINEKFKPTYKSRIDAFLFMGTNKAVKITDAKSGIIRRLIDVQPSGRRLQADKYFVLIDQVDFELGAIAQKCYDTYKRMGRNSYAGYRPVEMILQTDPFFNYVEAHYDLFHDQDGISLNQAYELYKQWSEDSRMKYTLAQYKFREELKNYFEHFHERYEMPNGERVRSYYSGFINNRFTPITKEPELMTGDLVLEETTSLLDEMLAAQPAQYATSRGTPMKKWADVDSCLEDLDTSRLHYVKPPLNHIVIDFDLKDEDGKKSADLNLKAASQWPRTYAERSQGGNGIHLHYLYAGDPTDLSRVFSEGIEIKVFVGDASLRRRLSVCNNIPVATLSGGLPFKEKKVIGTDTIKSEKALRELIARNLRKEIHPGTKPSIDFIHKILEDAYASGLPYNVEDMRTRITAFANASTNQSRYCLKLVSRMKFKSESPAEEKAPVEETPLVFFDVEVFPNLFVVCWKTAGEQHEVVRMINPDAQQIEQLMQFRLVGFNNRRYDNHILYARFLGYNNEALYRLSQKIIGGARGSTFGEAYNISYADIYDFSSKKTSLKKFEIELGLFHQELNLPWDKPVDPSMWDKVAAYCENDVLATEAVFNSRHADFVAREILAELSGMSINDTTQAHTAKILFGNDREASKKFVYTDLSEQFPGYTFELGKSSYRGEDPSEGGYVYAEPGMHTNVAVLDVASMHPTSIINLDLFGPYTKNFKDIVDARVAIKHGDIVAASKMLDGRLKPFLDPNDPDGTKNLAYALKIIINIVYGLTSAKFSNPFKDIRNVDNIVAKRGALFMIDLKHFVQERGFTVAHIKTDSIKIPEATPEIIQEVMDFGKKYGYTFEHESTYERMCLVNNAVYAAWDGEHWETVGAQYQHPYVFKTLFSHEPIEFDDMCETKSVTTALYLDMNEPLLAPWEEDGQEEGIHNYLFVGKVGRFCPVVPGAGGGILVREKDGQYHSASGTKGYRWLEADQVLALDKVDQIDRRYFDHLVNDALDNLSQFGDVEWFLANDSLRALDEVGE